MNKLLLLFLTAGLIGLAVSPNPDLPDSLKARLARAQRDYLAAKAPCDVQLEKSPAAAALYQAMKEATDLCTALHKTVNYNELRCDAAVAGKK